MDKIMKMIIEDYRSDNNINEFFRQVFNRYTSLNEHNLIKSKLDITIKKKLEDIGLINKSTD